MYRRLCLCIDAMPMYHFVSVTSKTIGNLKRTNYELSTKFLHKLSKTQQRLKNTYSSNKNYTVKLYETLHALPELNIALQLGALKGTFETQTIR